jgi:hypothetical protein
MINNTTMNDNNITKNKPIESVFNRIRFRTDRYPRTVIFDYSIDGNYQLQGEFVKLEEGEYPLFESYNRNGYTLFTSHYLYSVILRDDESPLLVKNQIFKVKIEDIVYYKSLSNLLEEKEKRTEYKEEVLKFIETTTEKGAVLLYLRVGTDEFLFHEILKQLVCMNNFYKFQGNK